MNPSTQRILTINAGSSSIKFALFDAAQPPRRILSGGIDRIGLPGAALRVKSADGASGSAKAGDESASISQPITAPDSAAAVAALMQWLEQWMQPGPHQGLENEQHTGPNALTAVGHRVVHGGPKYWQPTLVTPELLADLRQLTAFDPEHMPQEILLIEAFRKRFPDLPQVACFDTAFHHDLPRVAQLLPIPRRYQAQGVRRYGFHGLSYTFLIAELARLAGDDAAQGRVILAHLGNGASLAAVHNGKPVDTSMSFTPASGIPMSSRSGDLDPGLVNYFARTEGMTPERFNKMVNFESGLLGVSETSSDMHDLLNTEAHDARAAEAIALFCYQVKKWIGAFAAALGGLDTLVFAGGIGENAAPVRARICQGLEFLGIAMDEPQNSANAAVISAASSRVTVRVIRTDEERVIAETVCQILDASHKGRIEP